MFDFFKKKKKEKKDKKEKEKDFKETKQNLQNGFARGMYCPSCGYMEVREDSNALPMEGFAICPNCGDFFKIGWFRKMPDGYALCENEPAVFKKRKNNTGGHYRVRRPGPNRSHTKGNLNRH